MNKNLKRMFEPSAKNSMILISIIVTSFLLIFSNALADVSSLQTDKFLYQRGDLVTIEGIASPNSLVGIQINDPLGTAQYIVTEWAGDDGYFTSTYRLSSFGDFGIWTVYASEGGATMSTAFSLEEEIEGAIDFHLTVTPLQVIRDVTQTAEITMQLTDSDGNDSSAVDDGDEILNELRVSIENVTINPGIESISSSLIIDQPDSQDNDLDDSTLEESDSSLQITFSTSEIESSINIFSITVNSEFISASGLVYPVSQTIDIEILDLPEPSFTFSPESPVVGESVAFDAALSVDADGVIVDYNWDFGDGSVGLGVFSSHMFVDPGSFTVTLTVTDDDGLFDSLSQIVVVSSLEDPSASFTFSPTSPMVDELVAFDASASFDIDGSILSYDWDFGDGSVGSGVSSSHMFVDPGSFTVTLTVTDDDGLSSSVDHTITVLLAEEPSNFLEEFWWALAILLIAIVVVVIILVLRSRRSPKYE
jgi:PKD repeat protein